MRKGLLARIEAAQGFAPERFVPFHAAGQAIGWIRRSLLPSLAAYRQLQVDTEAVVLDPALDGFAARSRAMTEVAAGLHAEELLPGWRNELYGVPARIGAPPLLQIERAAATAFGTLTCGIHVNGHVGEERMWTARRAPNKATYPGRADVIVAGAIRLGEDAAAALPREAEEEAGIPAALAARCRPAGIVTCCVEAPAGIERGIEFCYDLALPEDFRPQNHDGEVAGFELRRVGDVLEQLRETEDFKPNCALVVIDFMVRHGCIRASDPDYLAIVAGLRRWELLGGLPTGGAM